MGVVVRWDSESNNWEACIPECGDYDTFIPNRGSWSTGNTPLSAAEKCYARFAESGHETLFDALRANREFARSLGKR